MDQSSKEPSPAHLGLPSLLATVLDPFLPSFCGSCKVRIPPNGPAICAPCLEDIGPVESDYCRRCGAAQGPYVGVIEKCSACEELPASWAYEQAITLAAYRDCLRDMILLLKFHGHHYNATLLGQMLAPLIISREIKPDAIVALPLSTQRLHERGYDQALLIAKALGRALEVPVYSKVLLRKKATKAQATLSAAERRKNVSGAFSLGKNADRIQGKRILVVDDVFTTGATLAAAGKVLKKPEPDALIAVCAARSKH